jgi:hypothetical protein
MVLEALFGIPARAPVRTWRTVDESTGHDRPPILLSSFLKVLRAPFDNSPEKNTLKRPIIEA